MDAPSEWPWPETRRAVPQHQPTFALGPSGRLSVFALESFYFCSCFYSSLKPMDAQRDAGNAPTPRASASSCHDIQPAWPKCNPKPVTEPLLLQETHMEPENRKGAEGRSRVLLTPLANANPAKSYLGGRNDYSSNSKTYHSCNGLTTVL